METIWYMRSEHCSTLHRDRQKELQNIAEMAMSFYNELREML